MNQPIFEKIKEKSEELFNMISRTSESSGMLDESVKGTPTSGGATTLTSGIGSMSGSFADDKPKGPIGQYFSTLHKEFIQVKTALPSGSPTTITWWKNTVKVLQDSKLGMRIFYGLCRMMVSMYFFNNAWSDLYEYWYKYDVISFPFIKVPVLICSALMFFNVLTLYVGIFLCLFAFGDALKIIIERLLMFVLEGRFYINELMTKKMAMFAGSLMVLIQEPFFKKGLEETSKAFQGYLVDPTAPPHISKVQSVLLLIVRALIAFLFIAVGIQEICNQVRWSRGGVGVRRPPGDGHDQLWLKVTQFALVLPFTVGFRTNTCAWLIAAALVVEGFVYWPYWAAPSALGVGYAIHARDHFFTNWGVAGGLLLLQNFGAGKYTVDNLLQKKKN